MDELRSPLQARVVEWRVAPGDTVQAGDAVLIVEAMKMEHELHARADGRVQSLHAAVGDLVQQGDVLLKTERDIAVSRWNPAENSPNRASEAAATDPQPSPSPAAPPRADLQRLRERLALAEDAARPEAMARRHAQGLRSARENITDLCDDGSFIEYGALAIAAQRQRRSLEDLRAATPADGLVCGIGSVNGAIHGPERSRTAVLAYDATVLAGTQGARNHAKTDRLLALAHAQRLPVVLFAEGGGGRPGDTDVPIVAGLHVPTFAAFARLSGRVPLVGIAAGRCFAGNAALLGCCDLIIATRDSAIGMGGPAMVEGGGLGVFRAEEIGPAATQQANGVIDVLVADEAEATAVARRYLSLLQGRLRDWIAPDAQALRAVVPQNRLRAYDSRAALAALVDQGSLLELRSGFGQALHTALGRIEGRSVGLVASNPQHLGGAIDDTAADKLARFYQLCDAHGLPLISLIDTPGFMVGPEAEARAQVRHASRLFVAAAALRVPVFAVVLRKAYGLGAMALAAGGFHETGATLAWPSAEFGAMGLEGAVRLGWRKELAAEPEGPAREALFQRLLAAQVEAGSAIHTGEALEIDAVIDPADTRAWLARALEGARVAEGATPRFIDPW